jgi:phosphate starvation-inducible protein PhoH
MAGTGKSFLALFLALDQIFNEKGGPKKLVIVRSAVPSRDMGFLPGNSKEKASEYESPYKAMIGELFGRGDAYQLLKSKYIVEFMTTSYVRGITINDAIVIVDEIQNMTFHEASSVITRVGKNCRLIICGDRRQKDLSNHSRDVWKLLNITERMKSFSLVDFREHDIVRSGLVKEFLLATLAEEREEKEQRLAPGKPVKQSVMYGSPLF